MKAIRRYFNYFKKMGKCATYYMLLVENRLSLLIKHKLLGQEMQKA